MSPIICKQQKYGVIIKIIKISMVLEERDNLAEWGDE